MKRLILTEKPSVARDFAKALKVTPKGDGFYESDSYVITWAIGHLLELMAPEDYDARWKKWTLENMPIIPKKFDYKPQRKTKKQLNVVLKQLKRNDVEDIVVATDAGREGELIARTLLVRSGVNKKMYRFWTSQALSSQVIQENMSLMRPLGEYDRLYNAGRCRQGADWLVGMNLSRLATIKMGDLFSIGRVQTAVLGLLVRRRKEIDQFDPQPYFVIKGEFDFNGSVVNASWFDPLKNGDADRLDSEDVAKSVVSKCLGNNPVVQNLIKKDKRQTPPQLFSLTELQKVANSRFGFTASRTLKAAQSLYEKYKCLSYPRTDARVLGSKSYSQVCGLINSFKKDNPELFNQFDDGRLVQSNRNVFDDNKLTDHHALIPLKNFSGNSASDESRIFNLVLKRFVVVFCKDYQFEESLLTLKVGGEYFKSKGKQIICSGWRELEGEEGEIILPNLSKGDQGVTEKINPEKKFTRPPLEYNEALLLQDMINPARLVDDKQFKKVFRTEVGLGTQATRAQIIETLIKRNYVTRDKRALKATAKGVTLIDTLQTMKLSSTLARPEETAKWELELEKMAQGDGDPRSFVRNIIQFINDAAVEWIGSSHITKVQSSGGFSKKGNKVFSIGKCPVCGGAVMSFPKSYSCSNWKNGCKFVIWKSIAGKSIGNAVAASILKTGKSDMVKGFKSRQGKTFDACLVVKDDKVQFDFPNS